MDYHRILPEVVERRFFGEGLDRIDDRQKEQTLSYVVRYTSRKTIAREYISLSGDGPKFRNPAHPGSKTSGAAHRYDPQNVKFDDI